MRSLKLPDGSHTTTGGVPTGELIAAWRASGAASVVAATSEVPSGRGHERSLRSPRGFCRDQRYGRASNVLSRASTSLRPRVSASWRPTEWWGLRWPGGSVEERWLQTDEGYAMTSRVACEVALRLATGDRRPGAHTPGRLFGPSLAESVGAHILANGA